MIDFSENHRITLAQGSAMTKRFRETISQGQTTAHYFSKSALKSVLAQTGAVGIRLYYGLNADNTKELVITGVNSSGNDMYQGTLEARSLRCPQECSSPNPLNSNQ